MKPKNYMISDNRTMKVNKRWSGEEETNAGREIGLGTDHVLGGLIV